MPRENTDRFRDTLLFLSLHFQREDTAVAMAVVMLAACVKHPEWAAGWYQILDREGAPNLTESANILVQVLPLEVSA